MSRTYASAWNELIGLVDGLDLFSAQKFIQRSYADIASEREWGFLRGRAVIQIPDSVDTGTVALTQFSDAIQFDTDAAAVLDAFGLNPSVAQCQIKVTVQGGAYSIIDYQPGGAATLDRAYQEDTDAASDYTLLRCFITPPSDFLRFISINDPLRSRVLYFGPRWTQQTLDQIDSQRTNNGDPYVVATYVYRDGQTQYELWPAPTVGRALLIEYRKRGVDLVAGDAIPDAIRMSTLMARAKYRAYEFGAAKSMTASKAQVFLALKRDAQAEYEELVFEDKKNDRAQNPDAIVVPQGYDYWPLNADYLQAHVGGWDWGGYGGGF